MHHCLNFLRAAVVFLGQIDENVYWRIIYLLCGNGKRGLEAMFTNGAWERKETRQAARFPLDFSLTEQAKDS